MSNVNIENSLTLPCGAIIKNRICKAAMTEGLADEQNRATQKHVALYSRWAEGGSGILLTGNVQIDHRYLERPANVVIEGKQTNEQISRLRAYAEAGTKNNSHLWMQISHAGRQTPAAVAPTPVGPSDIQLQMPGAAFGKPRALEHEEILDVIERFAHAAKVAQDTGFTGVQLHGAHGYLLSEFLSPDVNTRTDQWGGNLENRARLLLESIRAVRKAVGDKFPVALKLNSADFQKGGFSHEESVQVATWLNDEGLDMLEVSGGTYEQPKLVGLDNLTLNPDRAEDVRESTVAREAYFLDYAKDIRAVYKAPMMVTGGFRSRAGMDAALEADACDMIGVGRPLCVDSDIINKLMSGEEETTTIFEKSMEIGPKFLRPLLGLNSPSRTMASLNGWGQQGWWCLQIINMGEGREPDLDLGVFKAFTGYQSSEKKAAAAYNAHWNG
ncbi:MAG: NADH:flavin oxidoreductase/NADH oxidase family protein [Alphaproteobacteria bacterium]|nr:NADH:flavin oxidoreductase/NADH oxidase family protein [Alphaproteobacteria bacterium]